MITDNFTLRLF